MVGARVGSLAAGHRMGQVADDGEAIAQLLERLQRLGELEAAPSFAGVHLSIVAPCGM